MAGYLWAKFAAWLEGGKPVQLKAGDYAMQQNASISRSIEMLSEGKTTSLQGDDSGGAYQPPDRRAAEGGRQNLTGEITAVPPEGSLLPETFVVAARLARQAISTHDGRCRKRSMERVWAQRKKDLPIKSLEEALVLASIVEKETGRSDERERVAAVFHNRLRQNMRLQSDPTILYGLQGGKTAWSRPIQKKRDRPEDRAQHLPDRRPAADADLQPGPAAIEAVLNPADTKELYFVADGSGGHVFSETLKDHNASVQKWRAGQEGHEGRRRAPRCRRHADHGTRRPRPGEDARRRAHRAAGQARQPARQGPRRRQGQALSAAAAPWVGLRASLFLMCAATTVRGASAPSRSVATPGLSRGTAAREALHDHQEHDRLCPRGWAIGLDRLALGAALRQRSRPRHAAAPAAGLRGSGGAHPRGRRQAVARGSLSVNLNVKRSEGVDADQAQ